MKTLILPLLADGADTKAFFGRWDITVTPATGAPFPQWMELTQTAGKNGPVGGDDSIRRLLADGADTKAFFGRWDIMATPATGTPFPQWMELTQTAGKNGPVGGDDSVRPLLEMVVAELAQ